MSSVTADMNIVIATIAIIICVVGIFCGDSCIGVGVFVLFVGGSCGRISVLFSLMSGCLYLKQLSIGHVFPFKNIGSIISQLSGIFVLHNVVSF